VNKRINWSNSGVGREWAALAAILLALLLSGCSAGEKTVVVGSKNFTENVFLAELIAQQIERTTDYGVQRRFNLGSTFLCHQALVGGQIDVYPEYSGTALTAILKLPVEGDRKAVLARVSSAYAEQFGAEWIEPFGFNNTFAVLVRGDEPESLATISDLAAAADRYVLGFNFEFAERGDGFPGMAEAYDLKFAQQPKTMDLNLVYQALGERQIDVAVGNSTHGLIPRMGLRMLEDDQGYFPPYDAAAVVRVEALDSLPGLRLALESLSGAVGQERMQEINRRLDVEHDSVSEVASDSLDTMLGR